ncbi:MAG: beta-lactamase family protein [Actinobacteria bacterium]|nr:beta-lactamase family protein [Actinomycetota bacterium]
MVRDWLTTTHDSGVVGVSVAIATPKDVVTACSGVTSQSDPVRVAPETRFRAGSITKVITATLLVETLFERGLTIEEPARSLLPEFRLSSGADVDITVADLLSHTAGIDGELWTDSFGSDDDAIARYVAAAASLGSSFRPGAAWGYSSTGFVVAGRIVETLCKAPFHVALRDYLNRIGLRDMEVRSGRSPHGWANGHYQEGAGLREAGEPEESIALLPAGVGVFATASDLARFGLMHAMGVGPSPAVAGAMQQSRIGLPAYGGDEPTHHGLGWKIYDWPKGRLLGHNGNGTGQVAFLRVDTKAPMAVAFMTNTIPNGVAAWRKFSAALWNYLDIEPAATLAAAPNALADHELAGLYELRDVSITISANAERLRAELQMLGGDNVIAELRPVDPMRYLTPNGAAVVFERVGNDVLLHYGPITARRRRL